MNYWERHIGDYARDTAHLTLLEHGVYGVLLDRYYATEQGIPGDQAHRVARARTKDEREAVDAVLAEFFVLVGGVWINHRAEEEVEKARNRIESARSNGRKGGRPKKEPNQNPEETHPEPNGFSSGSEIETGSKAHHAPDTRQELGIAPQSKGGSPKLALPPWLEPEAWGDWHGFRNSRKGWTTRARELSLRKLTRLHDAGHDPRAVIEQSIERGWTGLFPLKEETPHAAHRRLSAVERVRAHVEAGNRRDADAGTGDRPADPVASYG